MAEADQPIQVIEVVDRRIQCQGRPNLGNLDFDGLGGSMQENNLQDWSLCKSFVENLTPAI